MVKFAPEEVVIVEDPKRCTVFDSRAVRATVIRARGVSQYEVAMHFDGRTRIVRSTDLRKVQ